MTLRIGAMTIVAVTDKGKFGCSHTFADGLNILRANNSAGKSTVLRGLIYALGLEGMFSPSHDVPLPHVLTEYIDLPNGNATVKEAYISLEISNSERNSLTLTRSIAGERETRLISVRKGNAIRDPKHAGPAEDYFVRVSRSARSDRGFHTLLAGFIGWNLPEVGTYEGREVPLYMELLFPLMNVEQKLGWGRIPAKFPTWYQVKDVRRRTVEFLLKLDAYAIAEERLAIQAEVERIRAAWSATRTEAGRRAVSEGAMLNAVPQDPQSSWPPEIPPRLFIGTPDGKFEQLGAHLLKLIERKAQLDEAPVPTAGQDDKRAKAALASAEDAISQRELALRQALLDLEGEISETEALEDRIASLTEDQRKYKDLRKLREMGGEGVDTVIHGTCPTCHQEISDSLMSLARKGTTMSVEQNVAFYDEQLQLSQAVLENSRKSISASEAAIATLRADLERLRSEVRSLRETLTAPSATPSIEGVAERVRLGQRIERLEELRDGFQETTAAFANLADDWSEVQERIRRLPKGNLSESDHAKLRVLEEKLQSQLNRYGFRSVGSDLITVSKDDYEPELSDINLAADAAASDVIRLQWAYLLALLETSREFGGNHTGLLIMDEPQQQSVEDKDFFRMLEHAAKVKDAQIIVGTSHEALGIASFVGTHKDVHLWELGTDHLIGKLR